MTNTAELARAFEIQSGACAAFGSAFSAGLLGRAKQDIEDGGPLSGLLTPWADASTRALIGDAVPLRWLGCLHDLVLSGEDATLAGSYPTPGSPGDVDEAWAAAKAAMISRPERFCTFMAHEPQTNEVRRSAALLPGFLVLAREIGLPFRIFEIGASAGLNQLWDRYHYDLGEAGVWGDPTSKVRLDTEWRREPPPIGAAVSVISRAACDRKPVDLTDPIARRRLKAFIWPDQFERLARLEAAIETALAARVTVEAEDAVTWVAAKAAPISGAVTVIFHSIFWQYMPPESQAAATAAIEGLGAQATDAAPLAWLRMEPPPGNLATVELRLTIWPGGDDRLLGHAHPHGAWVEWSPTGAPA